MHADFVQGDLWHREQLQALQSPVKLGRWTACHNAVVGPAIKDRKVADI